MKPQSDQKYNATLDSSIVYACWNCSRAYGGATAEIEVRTAYVGEGAPIQIRLEGDKSGSLGGVDDTIFDNRYLADLPVPKSVKVDEKIWFTATLPRHGLSIQSEKIPAVPQVTCVKMEWEQKVARRGDIIDLKAEFIGLRDIVPCEVHILEYDRNGYHDHINRIPSEIKNGKLNIQWKYEYHEDTDEIPTEKELKKYGSRYNPPEYYYVVIIEGQRYGARQESGLLEFKDWVEIYFQKNDGRPKNNLEYIIIASDGCQKKGVLNEYGFSRENDLVPGPLKLMFPDIGSISIISRNRYL